MAEEVGGGSEYQKKEYDRYEQIHRKVCKKGEGKGKEEKAAEEKAAVGKGEEEEEDIDLIDDEEEEGQITDAATQSKHSSSSSSSSSSAKPAAKTKSRRRKGGKNPLSLGKKGASKMSRQERQLKLQQAARDAAKEEAKRVGRLAAATARPIKTKKPIHGTTPGGPSDEEQKDSDDDAEASDATGPEDDDDELLLTGSRRRSRTRASHKLPKGFARGTDDDTVYEQDDADGGDVVEDGGYAYDDDE
jgi:hypothetical protein